MAAFRRSVLILALACAVALAGCVKQGTATTPAAPPTPPQITIAQSVLALSHATAGAVDALIACRQQQKCSPEDVTAGENVIAAIATAGKQIDAELVSADTWPSQRTRIVQIISGAGLAQLKARVSANGQLLIVGIVALFDNISTAVGGPTI